MFRRHFTSRQFIALLLPLMFLWSWAACAALCSEAAVHSHDKTVSSKKADCAGEWLTQDTEADDCSMTSETVVVQERQSGKVSQSAVTALAISAFRSPVAAWSMRFLPEIKQNSPPKSFPPPLLAFLCTFRI